MTPLRRAALAIVLLSCSHADPGSERGPCTAKKTCNGNLICLSDLCVLPPADCPAVATRLGELNVEGKRDAVIAACGERQLDAVGLECLARAANADAAASCPGAADKDGPAFWVTPTCHDVALNVMKLMAPPGADEAEKKRQLGQMEGDCKAQNLPAKELRCLVRAGGQADLSRCLQAHAPPAMASPPKSLPLDTKIGVATCETFVARMVACSEKVPPESREPMRQSLGVMLGAWADAAATPEGRAALASGCSQALTAAQDAYRQMGCSFTDEPIPAAPGAAPVQKEKKEKKEKKEGATKAK